MLITKIHKIFNRSTILRPKDRYCRRNKFLSINYKLHENLTKLLKYKLKYSYIDDNTNYI